MMDTKELLEILEKHKRWLNRKKGGVRANLSRANLRGVNLRGADLSEANLDYSCLPLWCGSLRAMFDDRQIIQIVYHAVKAGLQSVNVSEDTKRELMKVAGLANRFHRVDECGAIEVPEEE